MGEECLECLECFMGEIQQSYNKLPSYLAA